MIRTIGVFDSGVGGLSVLHHIRDALPEANLVYVADSGHVPYGDKSATFIEARAMTLSRFLLDQGAEAIVIACNTAPAAAALLLQAGAYTFILGCTHFPFLAPLIHEMVGDEITLVDTGAAVARELRRRVDTELQPCDKYGVVGNETFYTSGNIERATRIMSQLWGKAVAVTSLPQRFM